MAVIALGSAAGSPGVTTSALGLALTWPRPVLLIEADPTAARRCSRASSAALRRRPPR